MKVGCVVVIENVIGRSIKRLEMHLNRTVPSEKWSDKHLDKRDDVITEITEKWNKDKITFPMSKMSQKGLPTVATRVIGLLHCSANVRAFDIP